MDDLRQLAPSLVWGGLLLVGYLLARTFHRGESAGWTYAAKEARRDAADSETWAREWMEAYFEVVALLRRASPDVTIPPSPLRRHDSQGSAEPLRNAQRRALRQAMSGRLSMDELRNACFDLGCDDDGATTTDELMRRLIDNVDRRRQADLLVAWLKKNRSDIDIKLEG